MKEITFILLFSFLFASSLCAQDSAPKERNIFLKGYVKDMMTVFPSPFNDDVALINLVQNRLNFKWYASKNITGVMEIRNRFQYSNLEFPDSIMAIMEDTLIADMLDKNNDVFGLSINPINSSKVGLNMMIDRLYFDFVKKKLEVRIGRQRINWGINTVWNPNDVFNTFSYLDFDYTERPGSDAVRIQYYNSISSSMELAFKASKSIKDLVAAVMWKKNKWEYDFQFSGGVVQRDMYVGAGWAGSIKKAGFKGEMGYFHPYQNIVDTTGALSMSVSFEYQFKKPVFLVGSILFNSSGETKDVNADFFSYELSAKKLSPYKYSFFVSSMFTITPLFSAGLASIYSPGKDLLFINPTFSVSLKDNLDLDLVAQTAFENVRGNYKNTASYYFVRMKWSF